MNDLSPQEQGYTPTPAPPPGTGPDALPPGGGHFAVPDFERFAAIFAGGFRGYRLQYDEALKHSRTNAPLMRNDPSLMHPLRARQMPTALLSWHIDPRDEQDERQQQAAKLIEGIVTHFPQFQQFRMHLLEGVWYGRAACEIRYRWDYSQPNPFGPRNRRLIPTGHQYYQGDKIRFKWGGDVGVMVQAAYDGTKELTDWGYAHFLTAEERECFVVHQHEPDDADYNDPLSAGAAHGVGLRGRVYWPWWIKQQYLAQAMKYVERLANGFTIFYYDASNPSARAAMKEALENQDPNSYGLLVPRWGAGKDQNGVERLEVSTASPQFILGLIAEICDDPIRKMILGQDLTSDTAPTGLGSGVAQAHSDTLSKIVKYDAQNLEETLTTDLLTTLYKYNCPGVPVGRFKFDIDTPNATEVLGNAQILQGLGATIDLDHLVQVAGLPKPLLGDTAGSKLQPQAAAGVGDAEQPVGVPEAGEPVPQPSRNGVQAVPMSRRGRRDQAKAIGQLARMLRQRGNSV